MSDDFQLNTNPQPAASGTIIASRKRKGLSPQNGVAHVSVDDGKEYPALKRFKSTVIEHILMPRSKPSRTLNKVNRRSLGRPHRNLPSYPEQHYLPINTTNAALFSEDFTMHNDSFASQASDTPVVHANPDPSDRDGGQLDPQEFSFGDRASYGHVAYQDFEYEGGSTDGDYPIFTEEEGHKESPSFGEEGVRDGKMAPSDYPRSRHVDVRGPVLTVESFSDGNTIPLQQPDYSPSSEEGAEDYTTAPPDSDYYPGHADIPGLVVTQDPLSDANTIPLHIPNSSPFDEEETQDATMPSDLNYHPGYPDVPSLALTANSFSDDDTVPLQQPNHTPFEEEGAQDARTPPDPDYYPSYADVPSPVVIVDTFFDGNIDPLHQPNYSQDYSHEQSMNTMPSLNGQSSPPVESACTSQGVEVSSDYNPDNDIDTLRHVCTESSSYNDDPTLVVQSIQERNTQKQEPADINVSMDVPPKDEADKGEADEAEKQASLQIEEEDTEGFSTLPPRFCNENILNSDPQTDGPNSLIYPFDAASSEGTESYYSQSNSAIPEDGEYRGGSVIDRINAYEGEHEFDAASSEGTESVYCQSNSAIPEDGQYRGSSDTDHINAYECEHKFDDAPMHDVTWGAFFDTSSNPPPSPDAPVVDHPHQPDVGEDSGVLLEGGFDYHGHDVTKDSGVDNNYQGFIDHHSGSGVIYGDTVNHDSGLGYDHSWFNNHDPHAGAFRDHDGVNRPGSGAPGDLNQESQDSPHHTSLHGIVTGDEQGVSEDHHRPYQVDTNDEMQIDACLHNFVNDNTEPEDFETPNHHVSPTSNLYNVVTVEEIEDANDYAHTLNNLGMGDPIIRPVSAMGQTERFHGRGFEYFESSCPVDHKANNESNFLDNDATMDHGTSEFENSAGHREHFETGNEDYLRGLSPLTDIPDTPRPQTSSEHEQFETGNESYLRGLSPLTDIPDTPRPHPRVFATEDEALDSLFKELNSLVENGVKSPSMKSHFLSQMNKPKFDYDTLRALLERCYRYVGALPQSASPEHDIDDGHVSPDSTPPPKLYKAPKHRPENKNYLAEKVRIESGILLAIVDPNVGGGEPIFRTDKLATASRSAIKDFKNTRHNGPTIDNFVLQLDAGKLTLWNKAAADIFCKHFRAQEGHQNYRTKDVYDAFMAHITQLKRHFHRKGRPKTVQEKDDEKRARRLARRHSLLKLRIDMFYKIYRLHKGPLGELCRFIEHLTPECMSGDESGSDGKFYKTRVEWRSQELTDFLNLLSAWSYRVRYLDHGKYSPGELPRPRYPSNRVDTVLSSASPKLPVNWYDPLWLEEHEERMNVLSPQHAVCLELPHSIVRVAKRYLSVRVRADLPLPPDHPLAQ